jgi:hypothetical protein
MIWSQNHWMHCGTEGLIVEGVLPLWWDLSVNLRMQWFVIACWNLLRVQKVWNFLFVRILLRYLNTASQSLVQILRGQRSCFSVSLGLSVIVDKPFAECCTITVKAARRIRENNLGLFNKQNFNNLKRKYYSTAWHTGTTIHNTIPWERTHNFLSARNPLCGPGETRNRISKYKVRT